MSPLSRLKKSINHPWTAARVIKSSFLKPFVDAPENRVNILERDWDNLVILDACRYDTFEKLNTLEGDLEQVFSTASQTAEFVEKNITRKHSDTIYLTASPQLAGQENNFYRIEHLWESCWDDELKTVPPEAVTSKAIEFAEQYPEKRLVVHYMQPHYPFIGEKGRTLGNHATFTGDVAERKAPSVWDLLASGKVNVEEVQAAYEENLELVLPHVEELSTHLDGKTAVSSDHGNLFRKKVSSLPLRVNGHPSDFPDRDLLAVPWFVFPYSSRKEITEDDIAEDERPEVGEVEDRLKDLGYV